MAVSNSTESITNVLELQCTPRCYFHAALVSQGVFSLLNHVWVQDVESYSARTVYLPPWRWSNVGQALPIFPLMTLAKATGNFEKIGGIVLD